MGGEPLLEVLVRYAAAEADWPNFCACAAACFPRQKTGEDAGRHALASFEATMWNAAYSEMPEAKKVYATAKRYRKCFRQKWAAGEFDIVAVDRHMIEERTLPRGMAPDVQFDIDFEKCEIRIGKDKDARFGNCRVVASADEDSKPTTGTSQSEKHTGGRPASVRLLFAEWIREHPENHHFSATKIVEIYKAEKPNAPGQLDSLRKMVPKLLAKTG